MQKANLILTLSLLLSTLSIGQNTFTLSSNDLGGQATKTEEFNGFGCSGENQSPQLSWENAPEGTKSFAVTMYDPDAPTGSGFWHWVVFDIPADVNELVANAGNVELNVGVFDGERKVDDVTLTVGGEEEVSGTKFVGGRND